MAGLSIATLNCRGQSKMTLAKMLQIQHTIRTNNLDLLFCQETHVEDNTLEHCEFIRSNFDLIKNNAGNEYGTAVFVKNTFNISDINFDTEGRVIIFNIEDTTFVNIYPKSGTDSDSRKSRDNLFSSTLPNML